jgi:hypothetical protein
MISHFKFQIRRGRAGSTSRPRGRCASVLQVLLPALLLGFSAPFAFAAAAASTAPATDTPTVLVVVGVQGEEEFGNVFASQADAWMEIIRSVGAKGVLIGGPDATTVTDRERLESALATEPRLGRGELWVVLIGHGTFDGKQAKFNLRGPDVTGSDLADWLKPIARPTVVVDTSSASAPFMNKLAGAGRVIITATRSGAEENYTRFGTHFVKALLSKDSDFDKDGQISLLEAFLAGSASLAEFYKTEGRLASEHPLLDDNGDGLGTPPDWFRGVRAVKRAQNNVAPDGNRAMQISLIPSAAEKSLSPEVRAQRDALELKLVELRDNKSRMDEDSYYRELEQLLLQIAALYPKGN